MISVNSIFKHMKVARTGLNTRFSWLSTLIVNDLVKVVVCFGGARKVVAICTELVWYLGLTVFIVIFDPGRPCIGAYRILPDCEAKGTAYTESSGVLEPESGSTTLLSVGGPAVPLTFLTPARTLAGKVPVMPDIEKRGE